MKYKIITLILLCIAVTLYAQEGVKQTPPEGGKPKDFRLPAKDTFTLENGMAATLVPYGTLPKVTVNVIIRTGNLNEKADEVWLADMTGDFLKEGTKTLSAQVVAREAAGMGGSITVAVSPDTTSISGSVLSEFAPDLINLLADVVRNPLLPESEFARLRADRLRQLSMNLAEPDELGLDKFLLLLYPDHPYGRVYPTEAMLNSYTIEKIQKFYQANFCAARTHIYVAGSFDAAATQGAIRKAFADWTKGPEAVINIPKPVKQKQFALVDRPGSSQSVLYLGLPVANPVDPDYMALQVANSILGGMFSSRVTTNIREQKGYTYSPYSQVSARYRIAHWFQYASVGTDVTGPALKEIFFEIDRLRKEPPSAEELIGVQNYMAGIFVLRNSTPGMIINQLAFLNLHGLPDNFLANYIKNLYVVTPEDVLRIAKTMFTPENMTLVVVGDKAKIQSQLTPYEK